jgi:hypothetical protein
MAVKAGEWINISKAERFAKLKEAAESNKKAVRRERTA